MPPKTRPRDNQAGGTRRNAPAPLTSIQGAGVQPGPGMKRVTWIRWDASIVPTTSAHGCCGGNSPIGPAGQWADHQDAWQPQGGGKGERSGHRRAPVDDQEETADQTSRHTGSDLSEISNVWPGRALGERTAAELELCWCALQHITLSPGRIGDTVRAALVRVRNRIMKTFTGKTSLSTVRIIAAGVTAVSGGPGRTRRRRVARVRSSGRVWRRPRSRPSGRRCRRLRRPGVGGGRPSRGISRS